MIRRLVLLLFALAPFWAPCAVAPALARGQTLDSFLPEFRAHHPGRLSDAQSWIDGNGRQHYRVKWMSPDGRIQYFDINLDDGRYSEDAGEGPRWRHDTNPYDDQREETGRRARFSGEDAPYSPGDGRQGPVRGNDGWRRDNGPGGWRRDDGPGGWRHTGEAGDTGRGRDREREH